MSAGGQTTTTTTAAITSTEAVPGRGNSTESGTFLPEPESGLCGMPIGTGFIVGGEDAKRGNYPFAAVLGYDFQEGWFVLIFFPDEQFFLNNDEMRQLDWSVRRAAIPKDPASNPGWRCWWGGNVRKFSDVY